MYNQGMNYVDDSDFDIVCQNQNGWFKDTIQEIQWIDLSQVNPNNNTTANSNPENLLLRCQQFQGKQFTYDYFLSAVTWNGKLQIYNLKYQINCYGIQQMNEQHQLDFLITESYPEPVITHAWDKKNLLAYIGLSGGQIYATQLANNNGQWVVQSQQVGQHLGPVTKIIYFTSLNSFFSSGMDGQIMIWSNNKVVQQVQLKDSINNFFIYTPKQKTKPIIIVIADHGLFGCLLEQIFNQNPMIPNFMFTTLCLDQQYIDQLSNGSDIGTVQNAKTYIVSSTIKRKSNSQMSSKDLLLLGAEDGRAQLLEIIYFENTGKVEFKSQILFKTGSEKISGSNNSTGQDILQVFNVNSVMIHPTQENIISCANGYGGIVTYETISKSTTKGKYYYPSRPVSTAKYSPNGEFMAYALGYDWSQGWQELPNQEPAQLYIHKLWKGDIEKDT